MAGITLIMTHEENGRNLEIVVDLITRVEVWLVPATVKLNLR